VASALIGLGRLHAGAANGIAFTVAALASYVLNSLWTFEARLAVGRLVRFVAVAVTGLVVTVAITTAIQRAGYHYLVGIAAVVIVMPVLTFFSHRMWTYRAS
jgi:putative flippase GtrA